MSREIEVSDNPLDPWFDFWTARLFDTDGRALGRWRVPFAPPYRLRYVSTGHVVLDRVELMDYDGAVRATWDCRRTELFAESWFTLEINTYVRATR